MHRIGFRAGVPITKVPSMRRGVGGVIGEGDFGPIGFADFVLKAGNDLSGFWNGVLLTAHDDEARQQEEPQSLNRLVHGFDCIVWFK